VIRSRVLARADTRRRPTGHRSLDRKGDRELPSTIVATIPAMTHELFVPERAPR